MERDKGSKWTEEDDSSERKSKERSREEEHGARGLECDRSWRILEGVKTLGECSGSE